MAITLLVTDPDLAVVGDPLSAWTSLDCTLRFNEPASGELVLPAYPEVMAQLQPGRRLVVIQDREVFCAGPMEVPQDYSLSLDEGTAGPPGQVTVNFTDDLASAAGRITYPAPASAWSAQPDVAARQIAATNAETIIRTLVNENAGPGALPPRRVAHLALDTIAGVGTTVSASTRFEALLDACRRVAIDGGGLGFRTRQDGSQILFGVYAPADLTATARFSLGLGNLRALQFKQSAPMVTRALVSGTDDAIPRVYVEVASTGAESIWDTRVEMLLDASVQDDTLGEMTQEGKAVLAEGAGPVELATVCVDTEDLRAGRDYTLGDRVTVALPTGLEVTDVVRGITLQATPDGGEQVVSLIGSTEATSDPRIVRIVRRLGQRLGRLEAR